MDGAVSIEQQYALKWNDFHTRVVSSFQNLRHNSDFVDVTIACDDCSFSAHKVILSACSPYFRKLLKANPCQHPIIIFRDVNKRSMENILLFMYNGEVQLEPNQFSEFLSTAKMLQIEGLTKIKNDFNPACFETDLEEQTAQNLVNRSERKIKSSSPSPAKQLKNTSRINCHSRSISLDQDTEISDPGQHENVSSPENMNTDEIIMDDAEPVNPKLEPYEETNSSEHRQGNSGISDEMEHKSGAFNDTSNDNFMDPSHAQHFDMLQNMEQQNYSVSMTSSKLRKKLKLSKEDEARLITFMKINTFMWDMKMKDYKNNVKKEEKWKELSLMLQKDVDSLKKRWKSMKDYQKTKKKKPTGTGTSRQDDEERDKEDNGLDFLNEYSSRRSTISNINEEFPTQANRTANKTDSTQCPMCQRNYSTASNLRAHILNVHTPPSLNKWYQCSQCGKNCKTKHYLINHEMRAHGIRQKNKRSNIFNFLNEDTL